MLAIRRLSKNFGGVQAVCDVDIEIEQGAIHSVIGPNGAGKTTLLNLVTGIYTPSGGDIQLQGNSITALSPNQRAQRGMSRTFQNLQVCMNMSALENVMVGAHLRLNHGLLSGLLRSSALKAADAACRDEAVELMHFAGIGEHVGKAANEMSYGALKRLEIARALAAHPAVLLLDEPAAGLNNTETRDLELLIQSIAAQGVTVVLVEHDMKLVMGVSSRISVLDYGKKLAEGTPEQVRTNSDVIAAYLGPSI